MKNSIKKGVVIYNPISTGFCEKKLKLVTEELKHHNINYELAKSNYQGGLIKLVSEADDKDTLVITMGGDGTVSEAYEGISKIDQKEIYTHIPTGTTNDMASNYNVVSKSCDRILRDILNGEITYMDTFSANRKIAAYISAFGYLADIPYTTKPFMKKHLGHAGYVISALKDLIRKPLSYDVSYDVDGITGNCNCIFGAVSNAKSFAGVNLYKDALLDDQKIELLLLKHMNTKTMFSLFKDYLRNDIDLSRYQDNMILMQGKSIKLTFNDKVPALPIDIDGENSKILPTYIDNDLNFNVEKQIRIMKRKTT